MAYAAIAPTEVFDGAENGYTVTVYNPEGDEVIRAECYTRTLAEAIGAALVKALNGGEAALNRADRARLSDCLRACAAQLPYADTEKVALLDLAGRIEED